MFKINQQVEKLLMNDYECKLKYDEKLFTTLIEITNQIELKKVCFTFLSFPDVEAIKKFYTKTCNEIRSVKTQNKFSDKVSCFIKMYD